MNISVAVALLQRVLHAVRDDRALRLNPALYSRPTSILKLGAFQAAGTVVDVQLLLASSSSHSYTVKGALRLSDPRISCPVGDYDIATGEYVDLVKAGVVDPAKVIRYALQNAASISALMLITEALVT
jgi:hypothetical protein